MGKFPDAPKIPDSQASVNPLVAWNYCHERTFRKYRVLPGWNVITLINITLIFLFWGIICLNTYVLIPHFLFKGKYWTYSVCLLACTLLPLFMMFLVIFISKFYFPAFHEAIKPECNLFLFFFINFLGIFFYISAFSMTIFLQRWTMHSRQLQELEKNKVQNELDRLKDQVQPDFLSRMLNTANVLAKKDADQSLLPATPFRLPTPLSTL